MLCFAYCVLIPHKGCVCIVMICAACNEEINFHNQSIRFNFSHNGIQRIAEDSCYVILTFISVPRDWCIPYKH